MAMTKLKKVATARIVADYGSTAEAEVAARNVVSLMSV